MSELYQVGPDKLSDYDLKDLEYEELEWFVFWYEEGSYEGTGLGAGLTKDGKIRYENLGHCSCYGPMENFPGAPEVSVEEFLTFAEYDTAVKRRRREEKDYDYEQWQKVVEKVKELTAEWETANERTVQWDKDQSKYLREKLGWN